MASVYYDEVTGASLPSRLCEEAMQGEIQYMREVNAYTPCECETVKEQGLTPIGTRWVFTNKGDTERPFIRAGHVAQETKKTTKVDLTDTSMTFAASPPVEGCRSPLSRAMTSEKKEGTQRTSWSLHASTSPERTFTRQSAEEVAIRGQGDPPCPSGVAMLNRAFFWNERRSTVP